MFSRNCLALALLALVLFVAGARPAPAQPFISEFMADNASVLADEDGDFSDWIELFNPGPDAVDLDGYYLTDNATAPTKWRMEGPVLEAGGFVVVFASNKDRSAPGGELHANFKLSAAGEYLGLIAPDGVTVVSEFAPAFTAQQENRSFGIRFLRTRLLQQGAPTEVLVPGDGSLGTAWTGTAFSTGIGWIDGMTGVGFGLEIPGMTVRDVASTGTISSLADADNLLAGAGIRSETTVVSQTVNYLDTGADGNFGNNLVFPNGGGDDFVTQATGTIIIPAGQGGPWTFGINSDDGGRILIDGAPVVVDDTLHGPVNNFGIISLAEGAHFIEALFFERGGGAEFELFAARGSFATFDSAFRLVGDVAAGGLAVFTSAGGQQGGGLVATDLSDEMRHTNPGAYLRVAFDAGAVSYDFLELAMRYDAGYVAYLNGEVVASRNAPPAPAWDAAAAGPRSSGLAFVREHANLTPSIPALVAGSNTLAIHGLNESAADGTFLILPEISGFSALIDEAPVVFEPGEATPGGANASEGTFGAVADTKFDPDRGLYPNAAYPTVPFPVAITTATEGATIRYTTDGSEPTETTGTVYTGEIMITGTTTLRAAAFKPGFEPTNTDTQTYLVPADVVGQQPNGAPPPGWPAGPINGQILDYGMDPNVVNPAGAAAVEEALRSFPTISLVTPQANLTDPSTGIYTNAGGRGFAWEREGSIEILIPEGFGASASYGGTKNIQAGTGIRIRGGFSRSGSNPKHSFRLFFRSEYGDGKLRHAIFGDEGADEFDHLDLRGPQNYSWAFGGDSRNTFMRDVWSRDLQGEMGHPYTRSRFYHLYLNGIYWGVCQTQERSEADYAETYFGGHEDDYDVVKSRGEVADGNREAFTRLWQAWVDGFADNADFYRVQGLDASGARDPDIERLVDLENLIDYMLITYYTGDRDGPGSRFTQPNPNNYFGIFDRVSPDGFKYFEHDSEHSLGTGDVDMTFPLTTSSTAAHFNPHTLHEGMTANLEYRTRFADRAQELLFDGGLLDSGPSLARLDRRAAEVAPGILAHSARWGDSKREPPFGFNDWSNAVEGVRNFIRGRNPVLLNQLRARGWFPSVAAPRFAQAGGFIGGDERLLLGAPGGTIYYLLDGRDPRLVGGALAPGTEIFEGSSGTFDLVQAGSVWRYLDDGSNQMTAWREPGFDDSAWNGGPAELGYGDGDEATVVGFGGDPQNRFITTYFRREFEVADAGGISDLTVRLLRDDGGVVYLNGIEVFRSNIPAGAAPTYLDTAASVVGSTDEQTFFEQSIDPGLLVEGTNTLAVEIHQISANSSDISFDLSLVGTQTTVSTDVFLPGPGEVEVATRARAANGEWSALSRAVFYVDLTPAAAGNLAVSKIYYRPGQPTDAEVAAGFTDRNDFEFIELVNTSATETVHLRGIRFVDGIEFVFDDTSSGIFSIPPGGRVLAVRNRAAFEFRFGTGLPVAGEFGGALNNDGEAIALAAMGGAAIDSFTYNDAGAWPAGADGDGFSLVRLAGGDPDDPRSWRHSVPSGGSPGLDDAIRYADWKAAHGITSDDDDRDGDLLTAAAEYALGGDPDRADAEVVGPQATIEQLGVDGVAADYLVVRISRRTGADDAVVTPQSSGDLGIWLDEAASGFVLLETRVAPGTGREILTFRSATPVSDTPARFVRSAVSF
ncbi:hypothetical protein BH23VER1_BH23VER1_00240 [soil metagenome]